ncbi:unnamed protein product [Paramecium octaurelia]|uniref:Uncharacterized protein n=1 Tax=Paramecium octaurelia TaxID=43137 RepID=A0A8S1WJL4_PAROT|nr:unnamed protein product [Paramecium octaurelia]
MGIKCSNQSKKIKSINNGQQNQIKQQNSQEQNISECECLIWDEINSRFFPKVIQMSLNNKNETQYILDGQILRINDKNEFSPSLLQMANLEQIKYLKWVKKIGFNPQNLKKTIAMWNGEILFETGGFYSVIELKQGLWKQLIPNYWTKAKVYEIGEYQNNLKKGMWIYLYENKKIGGGSYDELGQKNGKWRDLSDIYWEYCVDQLLNNKFRVSNL